MMENAVKVKDVFLNKAFYELFLKIERIWNSVKVNEFPVATKMTAF